MFEKFIVPVVVGVGSLIMAAVGVDIYQNRQVAKRVDMSVKDLKRATAKDISEAVLEKSVREAANDQVETMMKHIRSDVMTSAKQSLDYEARKAVKDASEQIQKEVGEKISAEASLIDMTALKKSARDKAEEKILSKFDGNLEDLLSKFNDNLSNVQKIYGGIADAITKTNEKGNGIKLTLS